MLQDAGPLRNDGSDKFFGMENAQFGNTCYCNSILQCLFYSVPFRESVINYPRRSPPGVLTDALANNLHYPDPNIPLEELLKPKQPPNATPKPNTPGKPVNAPPAQQHKPEDKDSGEYKKKVALHTLPLLETTDNSASYGMKESLFTSLKDMFEAVAASPERMGVIRPYHFLEVLRREHEMFRTTMHQDAHEFLNLLLNEVVSNVEAAQLLSDADEESDDSEGASERTATDSSVSTVPSKSQNTRWVHELFEGTLTSETQCLTCETVSQRDEVFLDLSVDLEQHSSVTACLRKFSEEEVLCERNKFHCDNCGGLQEAEKRMKIKRLPKVLALHLKRFKYSEELDRLQKLFHRVVYPYYLRLFNTTDDAEDPDRLYELYAVVVHIGGGPYHGHYVAIIKTVDRGWLLFDDEMVEPVDKSFVRNFFGDRPGLGSAYVLFYQETTPEAMARELAKEKAQTPRNAAESKDCTSSLAKANGQSVSPAKIDRTKSAVDAIPTTETVPLMSTTTAPANLAPNPGEMVSTSPPNTTPKIKSPSPFSIPNISEMRMKFERSRAGKEEEKQKKEHEREQKKQTKDARELEESQLRAALAQSRVSKAREDQLNAAKAEKENTKGGLNRFRLGSRSISQSKIFNREKGNNTAPPPDAPPVPPVPPLNSMPESTTDVSSPGQPSNASTDDDKDDSTNATTVSTQERKSLNYRADTLPKIPHISSNGDLKKSRREPSSKRSRFNLRKKSFSVF
ncbi:CREB protein [Uncinocarpus reesii 1704]|uniref:ubiquitinyl hydrolase 1 n=1 Tax=Uncinocarpus reesii (strain UAMH 1704) TaxID=336963 RepID=C4JKS7_UNCRE|nr:CREB protein [Uncinocarpus reesii 1704]EEP75776.1 CREB protein [Uncinocarpus reesii 1704]